MTQKNESENNNNKDNGNMEEIEEQEIFVEEEEFIKVPLFKHLGAHMLTAVLPMYIPMLLLIYYPAIMRSLGFDTLFGLTPSFLLGLRDFWLIFFFPLYFIGVMVIYIVGVVETAAALDRYWNTKSPPTQGTFKRHFRPGEAESDIIKYYHYRGFIIKYPLWLAYKSPFNWLNYYVLKRVGHNHIHKTAQYIESFPCLEFSNIGENTIIYTGSVISSHIVDGIFGKLTISEVTLKNNVTVNAHAAYAPGSIIEDHFVGLPHTMTRKDFRVTEGKKYYSGASAKPVDHIYSGIFSRLPSKAEEIYRSQGYISGAQLDELLKV